MKKVKTSNEPSYCYLRSLMIKSIISCLRDEDISFCQTCHNLSNSSSSAKKKMQKRVCIRKTSDDNLTIILKLSAR